MKARSAFLNIFFLCVCIVTLLPDSVYAKVTGPCVNCHTMHNSQNGAVVFAEGPQLSLLNNTCIGCHSNPSGATYDLGGSITSVVYTTGGIGYDESLAGGNFYWVEALGDEYGHNAINKKGRSRLMPPFSISRHILSIYRAKNLLTRSHNLTLYLMQSKEGVCGTFYEAVNLDLTVNAFEFYDLNNSFAVEKPGESLTRF